MKILFASIVAALALCGSAYSAIAPINHHSEAESLVKTHLDGASKGGIIGGAIACVSLSINLWREMGFLKEKNPSLACLSVFWNKTVYTYVIKSSIKYKDGFNVSAAVNDMNLIFFVHKENNRWVIRTVKPPQPCSSSTKCQ